jgi:hypothetical protein
MRVCDARVGNDLRQRILQGHSGGLRHGPGAWAARGLGRGWSVESHHLTLRVGAFELYSKALRTRSGRYCSCRLANAIPPALPRSEDPGAHQPGPRLPHRRVAVARPGHLPTGRAVRIRPSGRTLPQHELPGTPRQQSKGDPAVAAGSQVHHLRRPLRLTQPLSFRTCRSRMRCSSSISTPSAARRSSSGPRCAGSSGT